MRIETLMTVLLLASAPRLAQAQQTGTSAADRTANLQRASSAFEAKTQAVAQKLKESWLRTHGSLPADTTPPAITSATLYTTNLNVQQPPSAPKIALTHTDNGSGVQALFAQLVSATTEQILELSYENYDQYKKIGGTTLLQSPTSSSYNILSQPASFGFYSAAGTWTVNDLFISDGSGNSTHYSGSQAAALFKGASSLTLVNNVASDTTPPTVTTGSIVTKTVSLSSAIPEVIIDVESKDNLSGVAFVEIGIKNVNSDYIFDVIASSKLSSPVLSYNVPSFYQLSTSASTGTWEITFLNVCDVAGNCSYIDDNSTLTQIFGVVTFQVVQ